MCNKRILKVLCLLVLCFLNISLGVKYFTNQSCFLAIMPPYIPYHKFMIYLSGLLEIVFALMMIFKKTRFYKCWGIILLLIAIFPANIYFFYSEIPQNILSITKHEALMILPYQFPLLLFCILAFKKRVINQTRPHMVSFFPPTILFSYSLESQHFIDSFK